jgi:apolipoprotein N-acyltransferase
MSVGQSPTQQYQKHHLVPFGEFIPLETVIGPVMNFVLKIPIGSQSFGPLGQGVMKVGGQKIGMDICYEDAFGEEIITALPEATLLINVSNDAWFGTAMGPEQHLQMAQTRALETGRPMVRATSTGVSAFIAEDGRIIERAPKGEIAVLERFIQGREGTTPFVLQGNRGVVLLCLLASCIAVFVHARNRRTHLK